jgi:hypothetical protein
MYAMSCATGCKIIDLLAGRSTPSFGLDCAEVRIVKASLPPKEFAMLESP